MLSRRFSVLLLLSLLFEGYVYCDQLHKLCIDNDFPDACTQIARGQKMKCQVVPSKSDCIIQADEGRPLLTVLTPEEALLGAAKTSGEAVVIGEITDEHEPYKTVVLVRSNFVGGLANLKLLRYCHPGYNHDELVTKYVLEELDRKLISLDCGNETLVEQKFRALNSFFGSSCRPGRWVEDDQLDNSLKTKYSNLCSLCGGNGCNTDYKEPFNDTLTCLTNNGGDVALTTLRHAQTFFSVGENVANFRYLCSNGMVSIYPCTWTNQTNRVLVTSRESAVTMVSYLSQTVPSYISTKVLTISTEVMEPSLAMILKLSRRNKIVMTSITNLTSFVSARRRIPSVQGSKKCGLTIRWSTMNKGEQSKCQWLQQAAVNVGLQPVIECIQSPYPDEISSLEDIKEGRADVTFVDANYGYIAKQKDLITAAYPETDTRQLSKVVLVIRNDSTFNSFSDLRGKGVCLPEYGGREWLAIIDTLRTNKVLDNSCDYGKLFSDFVGPSCAPGANSKDNDIADTDVDKFCVNCLPVNNTIVQKYCDADSNNKFFKSIGALKCLSDGKGDYAVVSINDLWGHIQHNRFKVVCKNGSVAEYTGFHVDEGAPLAIITAGEVVTRNGSSKFDNIVLLLRDIERQFGENLKKPFKVFDGFNATRDLLFPDSTPGLTFNEGNKYIDNFQSLLLRSETCGNTGSSNKLLPAFFSVIIIQLMCHLL